MSPTARIISFVVFVLLILEWQAFVATLFGYGVYNFL
jgi:hypothetical protein